MEHSKRRIWCYCADKVGSDRQLEFKQQLTVLESALAAPQFDPSLQPSLASAGAEDTSSDVASIPAAGWTMVMLNSAEEYETLLKICKHAAKASWQQESAVVGTDPVGACDVLLSLTEKQVGAGLTLLAETRMKPLVIDFEQTAYRQRLLRGGRQKEAVARAVMAGLPEQALVFDATAGLGRESMILAHAGARVVAFERQLPIWFILSDGLMRARRSRFFPFTLPVLMAPGTIKDYQDGERPEVIYYDPMFPERENSAQVKKDMFVFQQLIGADQDNEEFLRYALKLARRRVVVKRPSYAPPLSGDGITAAYSVDGGQCRFDCYQSDCQEQPSLILS